MFRFIQIATILWGCLFLTSSCRVQSHDGVTFDFVTSHTTALGVYVQMASWIQPVDYPEVGRIIDKYIFDFHAHIRSYSSVSDVIDEQGMALIIPERIHSFSYTGTATGCAAGLYITEFDAVLCAWQQIAPRSPIPVLKNILPALPHELSHRWLQRRGLPDWHNVDSNGVSQTAFPKFILDADAYAQSLSPVFTGDLSKYDPSTYDPNSCLYPISIRGPETSTVTFGGVY